MIISNELEKIHPNFIHQSNMYSSFLEISQSALNNNITYYKNHIGIHNKLALVIKGNGYGHGLNTMGIIAQHNDLVDWICVAHYSEALSLIDNGITKNILILGYSIIQNVPLLYNNLYFMVDTLEYATYLNEIGKMHSHQFNVHIKIDTGLSRHGIHPTETKNFIKQLNKFSYIKINGIFSHFIASDSNEEVTNIQFNLFLKTIEFLIDTNISIENIHMSNTAAITNLQYPIFCNMFRVGLGIYGFTNYFNNQNKSLQPALTWKTHIIAIKTVPAHSYVSYACTYKTTRTTKIALLPIGYSDGYQLRFSNKTCVIINNMIASVIGRIGMNITIIDVTDCKATIDDEVILLGTIQAVQLTNIAQISNIYNVREILTGLHPSIPRIITL